MVTYARRDGWLPMYVGKVAYLPLRREEWLLDDLASSTCELFGRKKTTWSQMLFPTEAIARVMNCNAISHKYVSLV